MFLFVVIIRLHDTSHPDFLVGFIGTTEIGLFQVVCGKKTLCNESCIPGSLQQVIQQLSSIRDVQRTISARDVESRLQEILHSAGGILKLKKERKYFTFYGCINEMFM